MWQPVLLFAGCILISILLAAIFYDRWRRKWRGERPPLSEKLLRPAGYSLQCRIAELSDSFMAWFTVSYVCSLFAVGVLAVTPRDIAGSLILLIGFGLGAAVCAVVTWRKLDQLRACRRGWLGEQAMAEQLQELSADGYRIFHDVPGGGKWNIDHVAVGPAGVFAIETKYRTKQPGKTNERDHEAVFDGERMQFPSGYDLEAPRQADRNARWLANEMSKAVGERVAVQPVVALPGWWVTLKTNSDVKVLSGKQTAGYIAKLPAALSGKLIQQINYQLEQRCRDVEF